MKTPRLIRLEVENEKGDSVDEAIIEDNPDTGLEIRTRGESKATSGPWTIVEIDHDHCSGCRAEETIGDMIGLTTWETDAIIRWRDHANTNTADREVSGKQLGEILDKIAKALDEDAPDCENFHERLKLKVEHEP